MVDLDALARALSVAKTPSFFAPEASAICTADVREEQAGRMVVYRCLPAKLGSLPGSCLSLTGYPALC